MIWYGPQRHASMDSKEFPLRMIRTWLKFMKDSNAFDLLSWKWLGQRDLLSHCNCNIRLEKFKLAVFNTKVTQVESFSNSACFVWDLKNQQSRLPQIHAFQSGDVRVSYVIFPCDKMCSNWIRFSIVTLTMYLLIATELVRMPPCVCVCLCV